jgi:hypothetical protein
MAVQSIKILGDLENFKDIEDGNVDVFVNLDDGHEYVLIVATQKNLLTIMNNNEMDFLAPGIPFIVVKKLTKELIEMAIKAFAEEDAYYLKFYAATFDIKTLNVLKEREVAKDKLLFDLIKKGESIESGKYNLIDFDINDL